jgi:biopolymer transport protein ExbD
MKINMGHRPKVRIEMLPLIDIVFMLLVVFIYAMLSMAVHKGLPVNLPESTAADLEKDLTLSVTVQAVRNNPSAMALYVDDEQVDLNALAGILRTRSAALRRDMKQEPGVLLFADRTIDYQQLFGVLDRIHQSGLTKISLQADVDE